MARRSQREALVGGGVGIVDMAYRIVPSDG